MKKIFLYIKRIAPWLAACGIFAYLFQQYPPAKILNALGFVNIPFFLVVSIAYFVLMFILDTYSISRVLNRFGHEGSVRELLPARGLTYLIMIVNYAASQAALAFYQYRKHGLPISTMLGIFGIIVVTDLLILATLAFVMTFFTTWPFEVWGMNIAHFVRIVTTIVYASFAAAIIMIKAHAKLSLFERLKKNKFFTLIAEARLADFVSVALSRLPIHIFIMCGMYIAIRTFNAHVSFLKVISNIPLVFFIGSLPITPGGLGTSNVVLVELLKPFITGQAINSGAVSAGDLLFSFSLLWLFVNYLMKALTGIICFKFVSRDLFKPTSEISGGEVAEEASPLGGNL